MTAQVANGTPTGEAPTDPPTGTPSWRAWSAFTYALLWAIFLQSVLAGALLSGESWSRPYHHVAGQVLGLATLVAAITAAVRLRRVPNGRRMTLMLFGLFVTFAVQVNTGILAADGENVMWIHVPLGTALLALAAQPMFLARRSAVATPAH